MLFLIVQSKKAIKPSCLKRAILKSKPSFWENQAVWLWLIRVFKQCYITCLGQAWFWSSSYTSWGNAWAECRSWSCFIGSIRTGTLARYHLACGSCTSWDRFATFDYTRARAAALCWVVFWKIWVSIFEKAIAIKVFDTNGFWSWLCRIKIYTSNGSVKKRLINQLFLTDSKFSDSIRSIRTLNFFAALLAYFHVTRSRLPDGGKLLLFTCEICTFHKLHCVAYSNAAIATCLLKMSKV